MQILVGTSGYSYKEWKGNFYPEDIKAESMLSYYAERGSSPSPEIRSISSRSAAWLVAFVWAKSAQATTASRRDLPFLAQPTTAITPKPTASHRRHETLQRMREPPIQCLAGTTRVHIPPEVTEKLMPCRLGPRWLGCVRDSRLQWELLR